MVKRAALLLLVNVAVFCVLAELLALGAFYFEHGWLFYVDPYRPTLALIPEPPGQGLTAIGLHPYFGPTHRSGIPFDVPPGMNGGASVASVATNNFGFPSQQDYPVRRSNDRQFFIGVFGGSVGAYFCRIGSSLLEEDLQRHPFFRNRELVTLCFSHEGYKQPQQLLLLAYFLSIGQPLDLVINIDGFNEVALGRINDTYGWDSSMPSHEHLDPLIGLINQSTLTPAKLELLTRITAAKARLNAIAARSNSTHSAAIEFALRHYHAFLFGRYQQALVDFDRLPSNPAANSVIHVTPRLGEQAGSAPYQGMAANWVAASLLMQQMLSSRGAAYLHVLQPNQYYTTRAFADEEKRVAFNAASPFKAGAEQGYPFLEKALEPGALNALHIFDAERTPVYFDDCCHYTLTGNRLLAGAIARTVLASSGPWTTSTP